MTSEPHANRTAAVVALLGRPDFPTDAVETYSQFLGDALTRRGWPTTLAHVRWHESGWRRALHRLWNQSREWKGHWILVQYTALSWSWRGLPLQFLAMLWLLRWRGARLGIVFHDPEGHRGERLRHRFRRVWQHCVMRASYRIVHLSIHTIPVDRVRWLPARPRKSVSIPVGSMIPTIDVSRQADRRRERPNGEKTVAVFCIRRGERTAAEEVADIAHAVRHVSVLVPRLRLLVLGRGADDVAKDLLQEALGATNVDLSVEGLLPDAEVSRRLIAADALLFVRGAISGGRSSAIAAIACGLPIVAYAGPPTGHPLTEAGVVLVALGDRSALAHELARVLTDRTLWSTLHQRNLMALERYFSWEAIGARVSAAFAR